MRWVDKSEEIYEKNLSRVGERMTIRTFLFFPKRMGKETRWLEFADIVKEYTQVMLCYDMYEEPTKNFYWADYDWAE